MFENLRIGTGIDVHAFGDESRPLIVGGVQIDHSRGLAGHSDADVLLHALVDALLGAMNFGDIGEHFSSEDAQWKGANSSDFVVWTRKQLELRKATVISIDSQIIAQEPKMKPYVGAMRAKIADLLKIEESRVSVKATTTDHLGFVGRKEGIACQASCLIYIP